jgi:hypothetical protein
MFSGETSIASNRRISLIGTLVTLSVLAGCATNGGPPDTAPPPPPGSPGSLTFHMNGQVSTSFGSSWR